MKSAKTYILGLSIILMMTAAAALVSAQAAHVRWDMISVAFSPTTVTFNPGGIATAIASDGSTITITGSGTFVSPADGRSSGAVTGGGTWKVTAAGGKVTGSGTFDVTELVRWEKSNPIAPPACFPCGEVDNVDSLREAWGGLAVLRVAYSDGTSGILTISCNAEPLDPFSVFEGMIASKGVVQYWNPSIFVYFSLFHVN
jgi:hypothetical protein